jgi:transposase
MPLAFSPGEAAQVDWGTATVKIAGEKTIAHLFCVRLCHSCAPFVMAFPVEREEAFLEAHQMAFAYFNGVARTLVPDYVPRNIMNSKLSKVNRTKISSTKP